MAHARLPPVFDQDQGPATADAALCAGSTGGDAAMDWKTLLVTVDAGPDAAARLDLACGMARTLGARLIGVAGGEALPTMVADPYLGGGLSPEVLSDLRVLVEDELGELRAEFTSVTTAHGLEGQWRGAVGRPSEVIRREAAAVDLVVTGRRSPLCDGRAADPGDVILSSGRPILVVPPTLARLPLGAPVLIAWSDTRESRRALSAALPLIRRAARVRIVTVVRDARADQVRAELADQVAWLGAHGIVAEAEARPSLQEVGDELLDAAAELDAGAIVAGGYGHARLKEWVMGGVTRSLLTQGDRCVLFSH
jgi:nucleotide-binding universal stress UspA family protein